MIEHSFAPPVEGRKIDWTADDIEKELDKLLGLIEGRDPIDYQPLYLESLTDALGIIQHSSSEKLPLETIVIGLNTLFSQREITSQDWQTVRELMQRTQDSSQVTQILFLKIVRYRVDLPHDIAEVLRKRAMQLNSDSHSDHHTAKRFLAYLNSTRH